MWRIQKCQPDFLPNAAASEAPTLIRHCNSVGPRRGIFRDVGHILSLSVRFHLSTMYLSVFLYFLVLSIVICLFFMGHAAWVKINDDDDDDDLRPASRCWHIYHQFLAVYRDF